MTTTPDHREVIHDAAARYGHTARRVLAQITSDDPETIDAGLDRAAALFLSTEAFVSTSDPDRHYVEMLLAYGGPTILVTVDPDGVVMFYHSWGKAPYSEVDLRQLHLNGADGEVWREMADYLAETGA